MAGNENYSVYPYSDVELFDSDRTKLEHLVRIHVPPHVREFHGPGLWPRESIATDEWKIRITAIWVSSKGYVDETYCPGTNPDTMAVAHATVNVEAIHPEHAPEIREALYWLGQDGRWRPGAADTPCLKTWVSYYF